MVWSLAGSGKDDLEIGSCYSSIRQKWSLVGSHDQWLLKGVGDHRQWQRGMVGYERWL